MKKSIYFLLTVFVLLSLCFGINVARAVEELKAVSFVATTHPFMTPMGHEWIKRMNENLKDKIRVKYIGGPEAVPTLEQVDAVRNNVVQVGFQAISYYKPLLQEAHTMSVARLNPTEMRKSGYYDQLVKLHGKIGIRYLGLYHWGQFYMWTKKPVKTTEDLKGIKMRTMSLYDRFQKALGITPVTIPPAEVFTALERGVVDGFCFPLLGPRDEGWTRSAKYLIDHPFYTMDTVVLMNLATWNKLPKATQDKIVEITEKFEPDMVTHFNKMFEKEWGLLEKEGVKKVIFSPEEAKKYIDIAYKVKWEEIGEKVPADLLSRLKQLSGN